jgi:hypothetical protein
MNWPLKVQKREMVFLIIQICQEQKISNFLEFGLKLTFCSLHRLRYLYRCGGSLPAYPSLSYT